MGDRVVVVVAKEQNTATGVSGGCCTFRKARDKETLASVHFIVMMI